MNKIKKINDIYFLETEGSDAIFQCERWYEKKTSKWYVRLPKNNPTGREFISEKLITNDEYTFENKTTGPRTLGTYEKSNWRQRLTEEELQELKKCELRIEELKKIGLERQPKELSPQEKLELQIKKLQEQLSKMKETL